MSDAVISTFKRYELKYFLTPEQKAGLMQALLPHFTADRFGEYTISNLYYDDDTYELFRTSVQKPIYKEKLRVRAYGTPDPVTGKVFVEIKKKYDHVVYKRRICITCAQLEPFLEHGIVPEGADPQIAAEILYFLQVHRQPQAKVFLCYDRTALAGIENPELRITFDRNLRWRDTDLSLSSGCRGEQIISPELTLMEIKVPGAMPLWLAHALSDQGITRTSFSKIGTCYQQFIVPKIYQKRVVNSSCSVMLSPQVSRPAAFCCAPVHP